MRRSMMVVFAASLLLALWAAEAVAENVVTVAKPEDHRTLNPLNHFCLASFEQFSLVYEQLVRLGPDGDLMPVLATSWEVSEDAMELKLPLRRGVTFHSGEVFDAAAVVFTLEELANHTDWSLNFVVEPVSSVEAVDSYTVVIRFKRPVALSFLYNLTYISILPIEHTRATAFAFDEQIGTGPFKFVEWSKGRQYVLTRNPAYWGWGTQATTNVDRFVFRPIIEATTRMAALLTGEADIVSEVPAEYVLQFKANPNLQVAEALGFDQLYLGLQTAHPPLDNVLVRKAIHYALDLQALRDFVMRSGGVPLGALPQGMFGANPFLVPYEHNVEKARSLLAEAGYPNGFAVKLIAPLTWYAKTRELSAAIADQLSEVGIRVTIAISDDLAFIQQRAAGDYDVYLTGGAHINGHPDYYLTQRIVKDIFSSNWVDEECFRLIDEARAQPTAELQAQYYREIMSILHERGPWIPVWRYAFIYAWRKGIDNLQLIANRFFYFNHLQVASG